MLYSEIQSYEVVAERTNRIHGIFILFFLFVCFPVCILIIIYNATRETDNDVELISKTGKKEMCYNLADWEVYNLYQLDIPCNKVDNQTVGN
ncbi:MAG: hypothetical protein GY951_02475 [Psychromonas sp.]|nr:hypothetical protein [Psychromonas sp.]